MQEIHDYVEKFANESLASKLAGIDGVDVHAVHEGYLLDIRLWAISHGKKLIAHSGWWMERSL